MECPCYDIFKKGKETVIHFYSFCTNLGLPNRSGNSYGNNNMPTCSEIRPSSGRTEIKWIEKLSVCADDFSKQSWRTGLQPVEDWWKHLKLLMGKSEAGSSGDLRGMADTHWWWRFRPTHGCNHRLIFFVQCPKTYLNKIAPTQSSNRTWL